MLYNTTPENSLHNFYLLRCYEHHFLNNSVPFSCYDCYDELAYQGRPVKLEVDFLSDGLPRQATMKSKKPLHCKTSNVRKVFWKTKQCMCVCCERNSRWWKKRYFWVVEQWRMFRIKSKEMQVVWPCTGFWTSFAVSCSWPKFGCEKRRKQHRIHRSPPA